MTISRHCGPLVPAAQWSRK